MRKTTQKLGNVSFYDTQKTLSIDFKLGKETVYITQKQNNLKEKHLIKQYEKLLGYQKQFEKEIKYGLNPDSQAGEVNTDFSKSRKSGGVFTGAGELAKQKLENVEQFITNSLLSQCELLENGIVPKYKSNQQKQLLKTLEYQKIENKKVVNKGVDLKLNGFDKLNLTPLDVVENKLKNGYYKEKVKTNSQLIIEYKKTLSKYKDNGGQKRQQKLSKIKKSLNQKIFDLD